jgi:hypothetical protein
MSPRRIVSVALLQQKAVSDILDPRWRGRNPREFGSGKAAPDTPSVQAAPLIVP